MVISTYPDAQVAADQARLLVGAGLAACVQCESVHSTYMWQGKLEIQVEMRAVFKTRSDLVAELVQNILQAHPYEVPEVLTQLTDANDAYGAWVVANTR